MGAAVFQVGSAALWETAATKGVGERGDERWQELQQDPKCLRETPLHPRFQS